MDKTNPVLLHIETATEVCSVAISEGDKLLAVYESADGNSHSKNLLPFIDKALKQADRTLKDVNAVVVSIGPGSYTGLRIGVSTAKSLAYALEIPVITISTLESIAQGAIELEKPEAPCLVVPMIDARRMEVFTARYDAEMNLVEDVSAVVIDENAFRSVLEHNKVIFCGNGMPKCKDLLSQSLNAQFVDFSISAQYMLNKALRKWQNEDFADVAYFEPFYLKEYVAAKPNVKGLH